MNTGLLGPNQSVPVEMCSLTRGQVIQRKMKGTQTSNTLKHIKTTTDNRRKRYGTR
jgi:hypothetical protein